MLMSFGCEQIVKVRAMLCDSPREPTGRAHLKERDPAAQRNREKGPVFAAITSDSCDAL